MDSVIALLASMVVCEPLKPTGDGEYATFPLSSTTIFTKTETALLSPVLGYRRIGPTPDSMAFGGKMSRRSPKTAGYAGRLLLRRTFRLNDGSFATGPHPVAIVSVPVVLAIRKQADSESFEDLIKVSRPGEHMIFSVRIDVLR